MWVKHPLDAVVWSLAIDEARQRQRRRLDPVRPEALLFELLYVHPFNSRFVSKYIQ
jgi:hypothetical protein